MLVLLFFPKKGPLGLQVHWVERHLAGLGRGVMFNKYAQAETTTAAAALPWPHEERLAPLLSPRNTH